MEILYRSTLLIVIVQGAILSSSLIRLKKIELSNFFVSVLSLGLLFHFLNTYLSQYTSVSIPLCLKVVCYASYGPLMWLHAKSHVKEINVLDFKVLIHFLPAILIAVFKIQFANDFFEYKYPIFEIVLLIQFCCYFFLAVRPLKNLSLSDKSLANWLTIFHVLLLALALSRFLNFFGWHFRDFQLMKMTGTGVAFIAFILVNGFVFLRLRQSNINLIAAPLSTHFKKPTIINISDKALSDKVLNHVSIERSYLNPDLTIKQLAEEVGLQSYQLSRMINSDFGINFSQFVNNFRIEEAKKLLLETDYKILAIAYESGFKNKTTFNRAFKKHTGSSPKEFRDHGINS